jgi:hypothetical protein
MPSQHQRPNRIRPSLSQRSLRAPALPRHLLPFRPGHHQKQEQRRMRGPASGCETNHRRGGPLKRVRAGLSEKSGDLGRQDIQLQSAGGPKARSGVVDRKRQESAGQQRSQPRSLHECEGGRRDLRNSDFVLQGKGGTDKCGGTEMEFPQRKIELIQGEEQLPFRAQVGPRAWARRVRSGHFEGVIGS